MTTSTAAATAGVTVVARTSIIAVGHRPDEHMLLAPAGTVVVTVIIYLSMNSRALDFTITIIIASEAATIAELQRPKVTVVQVSHASGGIEIVIILIIMAVTAAAEIIEPETLVSETPETTGINATI
jgi:hypothetical protein